MTGLAERFAGAAEALIGTPFRIFGRDQETGLDCVGLVIAALKQAGASPRFADHYAIRQTRIDHLLPFAEQAGFTKATGPAVRGDMLLVRPGPAQHHLIIASAYDRYVHAHAGLRVVVNHPGPLAWPIMLHWRLTEVEESTPWQPSF